MNPSTTAVQSGKLGGKRKSQTQRMIVLIVLLQGLLVTVGGSARADAAAPDVSAWQQGIRQFALPGQGCFTASYPTIQWQKVQCTTGPQIPQAATGTPNGATQSPKSQTVGNSTDYSARVVSGSLSSVTGTIPSVSCSRSPGCNVTETGSFGHSGPGGPQTANDFSLQLNSNSNIPTSLCSGGGPSCGGWVQFVYSAHLDTINVEPALVNFGNGTCPTGFINYGGSCYDLNLTALQVPGGVTVADLPNVSFTGSVSAGGNDTVVLTNSGTAWAVTDDSPVDAAGHWTDAEFGVFGDAGGSQAKFSAGTTLQVITATDNGTPLAPMCVPEGFTGETNNLKLVRAPATTGSSPAIVSEQSNVLRTAPFCTTAPEMPPPADLNHVFRVGSTSTTYYLDSSGVSHWIPNGGVYLCLTAWDGVGVIDGTQAQLNTFPVGSNESCQVTQAFNSIIEGSNKTSYYVDGSGTAHWIPNGGVFSCLYYWDGVALLNNLSQAQLNTFPVGSNESCQVTHAFNTIIEGSDGTSYYVDGSGTAHWIPNGGVFSCLYYWDGIPLYDNLSQAQLDTFPVGSNEGCQVTQAFNTVIRESTGTAYYIDDTGVAHWIQNGATYNCLVYGEGLPLYNNVTQNQVNTFAQGSWEPDLSC